MAAHTALDHERAVEPGDEGLGLLRATEAKGTLAVCLDELARATLASGDIGRSARYYHEVLTLWAEAKDAAGLAKGLEGMARVAEARGRALDAQRLLAAAAAWREERGMTFEQALALAREHVDLQKGT